MVRFKLSRFFVYFFFASFFGCASDDGAVLQNNNNNHLNSFRWYVRVHICVHACGFSFLVMMSIAAGVCWDMLWMVIYDVFYKMSTLKFYVCAQPIKIVTRMLVNFLYTRYNCCPSHRVVFWKL